MSENGRPHRDGDQNQEQAPKSTIGEVLGLLEDQMDLAALEWDFEKKHNARRFGAFAGAAVLFLSAFLILQAAAVLGLMALGLPAGWACVTLASVECLLGALLIRAWGKRDPKAGAPFQGTRIELRKNIHWIRQLLS